MPLRPCLQIGCEALVKSGRCTKHKRAYAAAAKARARPFQRIYDDKRWETARTRAIRRAGGRCQALENGQHGERCPRTQMLQGHHSYPGGIEQMLRDGVNPFDIRWIVVLCRRHHGQAGGWARSR